MIDRFLRKASLLRLDPAPFKREAMRVLMQAAQQVEVRRKTPVMVASRVGTASIFDPSGLVLPLPPVVQVIAAFDLVSRGRSSPEEAVRKPLCQTRPPATATTSVTVMIASTTSRTPRQPIGPTTAVTALSLLMP